MTVGDVPVFYVNLVLKVFIFDFVSYNTDEYNMTDILYHNIIINRF